VDDAAIRLPVPELSSNTRSALIIATSQYDDSAFNKLRAPVRDAEDLAEVLGDPAIGGFTVITVVDQSDSQVSMAIAEFLKDRSPDETVLVYLSCHGIQDRAGRLCFATTNTVKDQPRFTSVKSADLLEELDDCRARQQILILDCCFSGAFGGGRKGGQDLKDQFVRPGRGRVVLTASRGYEYSFEGEALNDNGPVGSVFTTGLVQGMRSGHADTDGDGYVAWDEAFAYAERYVQGNGARQTPQQWLSGGEGAKIILARSPAGQLVVPAQLPEDLAGELTSRSADIRIGAVNAIAHWLHDPNPARVVAAEQALLEVVRQDNPTVAKVARARLEESARPGASQVTDSEADDAKRRETRGGSYTDEANGESPNTQRPSASDEAGTDDDTGAGWRRQEPWFTRFLIAVSGASVEILQFFPQDRAKYIAFGSLTAAAAVLSALGIYFVLRTALTEPLVASAIIALLSGLVVLAIDRWLIVTVPRGRNSSRTLLSAIPRLLFALLLSAIIAGPIILQIFRSEINEQVMVTNLVRSADFNRQLETSGIGAQVTKDQAQVNKLVQIASSSSKQNATAVSVAKDELPAARQKLASDQMQEEQQNSTFNRVSDGDTGLPASIAALVSACSANAVLCISSIIIFLVFVFVSMLPLVMQIMLSFGPESAYERAASYDNDIAFQAAATMRRRQIERMLRKST
jgi:hypothetical protein